MDNFLLISCTFDGDSYKLFNNIQEAKDSFDEECADECNNIVVLCAPKPGESFGFGPHGFWGGDVIFEWEREE